MRQFLTESLLLAGAGGAAGLLLAVWGVRLLASMAPVDIAHLKTIAVDWRALGFTLCASLVTGLACGLAPAVQSFNAKLNEALKEGGRDASGGRSGLGRALVVGGGALTLVLVTGGGLWRRTFFSVCSVGSGSGPQE